MLISLIKDLRDWYLAKIRWREYVIGPGFHAGIRVRLWARNGIKIGRNFYIGRDSQIETDCEIGDNVIFANKVAIVGRYDHHFQMIGIPIRKSVSIRDKAYNWKGKDLRVHIGDDVWIGYGVIIISGVTIADGAIVAAGSVVTKDIEPYAIYAGNPARKIRNRFDNENELQKHLLALGKKH